MSNMGYCRFRNTLSDMHECLEAIQDGKCDDLMGEELSAAKEMQGVAEDLASELGELLSGLYR